MSIILSFVYRVFFLSYVFVLFFLAIFYLIVYTVADEENRKHKTKDVGSLA